MKFAFLLPILAVGVTSLHTVDTKHEVSKAEHDLFFCCDRRGGEKCGWVWRSCCFKGKCATNWGVEYCPD